MSWTVESLHGLTGDAFEDERNRIIMDYFKSLPENRRRTAYAMQCRIDLARMTLSEEDYLRWFQAQGLELAENLADQLVRFKGIVEGPPTLSSTTSKDA